MESFNLTFSAIRAGLQANQYSHRLCIGMMLRLQKTKYFHSLCSIALIRLQSSNLRSIRSYTNTAR